ncbi:sushi domain (scr repeat) domain-containing protein [Cystoisospora suis]|uniref:Sushi domain (Scr repeat) domain-containing protein n=1 Tax=Cystoisospora suis TaxID=483139 RepID=A0A2C6LDW5_9APIC|nr:sushi domain (scr repeat) domain-containing protein [Cystoisospora suis]
MTRKVATTGLACYGCRECQDASAASDSRRQHGSASRTQLNGNVPSRIAAGPNKFLLIRVRPGTTLGGARAVSHTPWILHPLKTMLLFWFGLCLAGVLFSIPSAVPPSPPSIGQLNRARFDGVLLPVQGAAAPSSKEATEDLPKPHDVVASHHNTAKLLTTESGGRPGVLRVFDALGGPMRGSGGSSLFNMNNRLFQAGQLSPASDGGTFFRGDTSSRGQPNARSHIFATDSSSASADIPDSGERPPARRMPTNAPVVDVPLEADEGGRPRQLQQDRRHAHPPKSMRDVSKRLLELHSCVHDTDCFGAGRRCIERRCWGFAGPETRPFLCRLGDPCHLTLKGHFYGEGGQAGNGVFALRVVKGEGYATCGLSAEHVNVDAGAAMERQHGRHSAFQPASLPDGFNPTGGDSAVLSGGKPSSFELEEDFPGFCPAEDYHRHGDCPLFGSEPIPKQPATFNTSKYIVGQIGDQTEDIFVSGTGRGTHTHDTSTTIDGLLPEEILKCTYESSLRPQAECALKLGSDLLNQLNVGTYTLCGCSGTDLTGQGEACSAVEDFAVPVGRLVVAGFTPHQAHLPHEISPVVDKRRGKESVMYRGTDVSSDTEAAFSNSAAHRLRISSDSRGASDHTDDSNPALSEHTDIRTFVCTVGNVCELSKMWGVGLDAGSFYVEALPSEQADSCEGLRGDSSVLTEEAVVRLPCRAYAEGSFCVVSLPPAALAALSMPTARESSAHDHSTDTAYLPGSRESQQVGDAEKAHGSLAEETEAGLHERKTLKKKQLLSHVHAGHRRLSIGSLSSGIKPLLKQKVRWADHQDPSSAVLHDSVTPMSPRRSGTSLVSVATLCGCNSRLDGPRCEAPVLLGKLIIKTPKVKEDVKYSIMRDIEDTRVEEAQLLEDSLSPQSISLAPFTGAPATTQESTPTDLSHPSTPGTLEESDVATNMTASSGSTNLESRTNVAEPSKWRLLQYITGPAANSQAALEGKKGDGRLATECKVNTDCFGGMGVCDKGRCVGFVPDKQDSRLFRCVEGYWCDIKPGDIPGKGITDKFEVIATTPSEPCGTARNLKPTESLFANANKWICDSTSPSSCIFRAGVGHRRNKTHTVEGVRLCGCPNLDTNGDDVPCNHVRDFFVPLGRLGVQECLTNAHCVDNAFAYCVEDHCGGFLVSAAAAGVNAFTCIRNQQCTLQSIAAKSVDQALKVIPVAANFSCGAEAALDPDYVKTSALPCVADVNNDGVCDINLGVNRALGQVLQRYPVTPTVSTGTECEPRLTTVRLRQRSVTSVREQVAARVTNSTGIVLDFPGPKAGANAGVTHEILGLKLTLTTRLCGCSGQDVGGNGKTCDEASDFDKDLGLVANVQCIVNQDCPNNALCAKGECVEDDMDPYIVSMYPMNDTFAVPPVTHIDLIFNENIKFGRPRAALMVANLQNPSQQYLITLPNNAANLKKITPPVLTSGSRLLPGSSSAGSSRSSDARAGSVNLSSLAGGLVNQSQSEEMGGPGAANNKWVVEILGQKLRIIPDKDAVSLPLGDYRIGIEFGFVTDLIGNMNKGENNLRFTLSNDANCPFLYVTGFTTENGNCNGLYSPADPMNDQASWQGGEKNAFFIYWKKEVRDNGKLQQGGNWIVDTNYDDSSFLAFADLTAHADKKRGRSKAVPPSGLWHKWTGATRSPQPEVSIYCAQAPDRSPASLIAVDPPIGSPFQLSASTLLPLRPITLTFNKPMNYGHWASIKLVPRNPGGGESGGVKKRTIRWITDLEAGMRGDSIKISNRPAKAVIPSAASASSTARTLNENRLIHEVIEDETEADFAPHGRSASPSSQNSLLRSPASRQLQRSTTPPPSSGLVGVVELHVKDPLVPGETYDLVAELGALTDLAYNPWGPVEKGIIVFHTTGGRCAAALSQANVVLSFPEVSPSRTQSDLLSESGHGGVTEAGHEILGLPAGSQDADDGTQIRVRCRPGYSVHASLKNAPHAEETHLVCEDGKWRGSKDLPKCFPSCGPYPVLGGAYRMSGDVGGEGLEGEVVNIQCTDTAEVLSQVARQAVTCTQGKWEPLLVKCGATCPPLGPTLGSRYQVMMTANQTEMSLSTTGRSSGGNGRQQIPESREAKEGEKRTVLCAEGASSVKESYSSSTLAARGDERQLLGDSEEVLCGKTGWADVRLKCFADCPKEQLLSTLLQHGQGLEPSGGVGQMKKAVKHGERQTVKCASGFLPSNATRQTFVTTCHDGRWQALSPAPPSSPLCVPRCPPLDLPPEAYTVSPLPDMIGPDGALQQVLEVTCAPQAVAVGSSKRQQLTCSRGGVWDLLTVQCKAPCGPPLEQLGDRYELRNGEEEQSGTLNAHRQGETYKHGTEAVVGCAPGAAVDGGALGDSHKIACDDGTWQSAYRVVGGTGLHGVTKRGQVDLKCRRGCGVPPVPPELQPRLLAPRAALLRRWEHEQQLQVACARGFSSQDGADFEVLTCRDGSWEAVTSQSRSPGAGGRSSQEPASTPRDHKPRGFPTGLKLACRRECDGQEIRRAAQIHHFEVPSSFSASSFKHNAAIGLSCQAGFSVVTGDSHNAEMRCRYGSLELPRTVCARPSCSDGIMNGDETGVDCGGMHCSPCTYCEDGVQNNGETGVDCGGPCPACVSCSFPPPAQVGLDNKQVVSFVLPPSNTGELSSIPRGLYMPLEEAQTWVRRELRGQLPPGAALHIQCAHPSALNASEARFAVLSCKRGRWAWSSKNNESLSRGMAAVSGGSPLVCKVPSCFDGIRNGDETGVDCGGSCTQVCPSCFNGIKDGDEDDVDCGGSTCEPCGHCSPRALKPFLRNKELFVVRRHTSSAVGGAHLAPGLAGVVDKQLAEEGLLHTALTKPGQQLQVKCKLSTDTDVVVQCRNGIWSVVSGPPLSSSLSSFFASSRGSGMWWPQQAAEAHQVLENFYETCASQAVDLSLEGMGGITATQWTGKPVGLNNRSRDSIVAPLTWKNGGALATFAVPDFGLTSEGKPTPPCVSRMLDAFRSSLRGECGALVFGNSALKLSSFCANSCMRSLKSALATVEASDNVGTPGGCSTLQEATQARQIAKLLLSLLDIWCTQKNGLYCFAEASASFNFVRSMYTQARASPSFFMGELSSYCPADSCFRSNIRQLVVLAKLSQLIDVHMPAFPSSYKTTKSLGRNLSSTENAQVDTLMGEWDGAMSRESVLGDSFRLTPGVDEELIRQKPEESSSLLSVRPASPARRLLPLSHGESHVRVQLRNGVTGSPDFQGTKGFLEDITNISEIVDLLCIEVDGRSCAEDVLKVGLNNPVFNSPVSDDEKSQRLCTREPCLLEVTRVFGQLLIDASDRAADRYRFIAKEKETVDGTRPEASQNREETREIQPHPYNAVLGMVMKHWGRTFCHRNMRGSLCGGLVFPSVLDVAVAQQSRANYTPADNERRYRKCTCPTTLIGDGDCDVACFNEECGWDGGDCLATELVFPVYRHLVNQIGTEVADACNPFNAAFACGTQEDGAFLTADTRKDCTSHFKRLVETRGCCLAAQLELLRDLLETDLRLLAATGNSPSSYTSSTGLVNESHKQEKKTGQSDGHQAAPTQLWRSNTWVQIDRSSAFFEFACKRQLDRTCSRGLNRSAYAVEMKLENLNFDALIERPTQPSTASTTGLLPSPDSGRPTHQSVSRDNRAKESPARALVRTPRESELRRVLREELAALLALPAADIVEMRLWRGSVDVSAVVDAGWLANKATFKERVQALTADPVSPLSLNHVLSESLTRHLSSTSSALLSVLPTTPAGKLLLAIKGNPDLAITLAPAYTKITQIPFQQNSSAAGGFPLPLFGTFGTSELLVTSRPCVDTQGLIPPDGTSVYDAYKIWAPSRGSTGHAHGSTMVVECNTGHEPVEGVAPQTLVCNQGRWEPPTPSAPSRLPIAGHQRILVCRRPCPAYEKVDPMILRAEFVVSGLGTSDGDARTVMCAPGYSPRDPELMASTETIECVNGEWKPQRGLVCEKDFAAVSGSSSSFCSGPLSGLEESYKLTEVSLSPAKNPDISPDLSAALNIRLQPTGTTVQIFQVTCARGYIHAPSAGPQVAPNSISGTKLGVLYLACLEGALVTLGSEELFPLGGSAQARRAEHLAESFESRLRNARPMRITPKQRRPSASASFSGEEEDDVKRNLLCVRDVRLDPPPGLKPISDTVMVFLCLLILFVLVVALIAGWWIWNARKKRKAARSAAGGGSESHGGGSCDESDPKDAFKRRITGEAVMMDGSLMMTGASAEQFLATYLMSSANVGTAKLVGDSTGTAAGSVMLGPLKEHELLAAQMYIDHAHAETSPSFAKPSGLMKPATAAMMIGTQNTQNALMLLQQQNGYPFTAVKEGDGALVRRMRPPAANGEDDDGRTNQTSFPFSPIYLRGLPGDRGSVQEVREQSVLEDESLSTVASKLPTEHIDHQQFLRLLQHQGGLQMQPTPTEGATGCRLFGQTCQSGRRSFTQPDRQLVALQQNQQAIFVGDHGQGDIHGHLSSVPLALDEGESGEEGPSEPASPDVDARVFGTASPSMFQQVRPLPPQSLLSGQEQRTAVCAADRGETRADSVSEDPLIEGDSRSYSLSSRRHGKRLSGSSLQEADHTAATNSCGGSAGPRRHSLYSHMKGALGRSPREDRTARVSPSLSFDPASCLDQHQQPPVSPRSEDELYPDDSASCVGQQGYRLTAGLLMPSPNSDISASSSTLELEQQRVAQPANANIARCR